MWSCSWVFVPFYDLFCIFSWFFSFLLFNCRQQNVPRAGGINKLSIFFNCDLANEFLFLFIIFLYFFSFFRFDLAHLFLFLLINFSVFFLTFFTSIFLTADSRMCQGLASDIEKLFIFNLWPCTCAFVPFLTFFLYFFSHFLFSTFCIADRRMCQGLAVSKIPPIFSSTHHRGIGGWLINQK